ncbi:PAS domain-containing protein, partial [Kineococcus glutinatus]|uniref:PAS domain-containing protein n=1 Tax=Kineococcus glutinatus TaxID=1070872 RepID=UPI0031F176B3
MTSATPGAAGAAGAGGAAWDASPCGLLVLDPDGLVLAANAEVLRWLGRPREEVVGGARIGDLLTVGGRIYWETHLYPLLCVERRVEEVALELRVPGGRLPVLLSAAAGPGEPLGAVHVSLSSAR